MNYQRKRVAKDSQELYRWNMPLQQLWEPRPSVFETNRRATVLSLDAFLKGEIKVGEFFEENYFTNGRKTLLDRCHRSG